MISPNLNLLSPPPLTQEEEKLVTAARGKDVAAVRALLEKGVRVEKQMGMGWHPLVLAASFGLGDIVDKVHNAGEAERYYYTEALHAAAGEGHRDLVYQILDYGFDATSRQEFDIALATMLGGHLDLLKEFISRGFTTDLTCAVYMQGVIEHDHADVLDFMLDHGASLEEANRLVLGAAHKTGQDVSFDKCRSLLQHWGTRPVAVFYKHEMPASIDGLRAFVADADGYPVTALLGMVKGNRFGSVMKAVRESAPRQLEPDDFLAQDTHGTSVIEILGAKNRLSVFFTPEIWGNRLDQVQSLYEHIAPVYKNQIDMTAFTVDAHQSLLRKSGLKTQKLRI